MDELRAKGAEFSSGPDDHGYGIVAMLVVPGADDVQLYQPRHQTAYQPLVSFSLARAACGFFLVHSALVAFVGWTENQTSLRRLARSAGNTARDAAG